MEMSRYEVMQYLSYVVMLAANVIVAGVCFERFRALRSRPLLLLAIAAVIAVLLTFLDVALEKSLSDKDVYVVVWTTLTVLKTVDVIMYAIGVVLLVKSMGGKPASRCAGDEKSGQPSS